MNTRKLTTMAMLTGVSLIIFLVEAQIPLPFTAPGVKLGLANVITLFALCTLGRREAGAILLIRVLLGNLIVGNLMALAYSLAGGLLCWATMSLLLPLTGEKYLWLTSVFGAIAHNVGQLLAAVFVSGTASVALYAPVLLIAGVITGFFTGQAAQAVLGHMDKIHKRGGKGQL